MTTACPLFLALVLAGLAAAAPATAAPTGAAHLSAPFDVVPITYLHSHHHAVHHYGMTYGNHHRSGHAPGHYAHGDGSHRTTATGGNPGGFSSRN